MLNKDADGFYHVGLGVTLFPSTIDDRIRNSMEKVIVEHGVEVIASEAFEYCQTLKFVILSDGVETIENLAFAGCRNLEGIVVPSSVTYIANDAFSGSGEVLFIGNAGSYVHAYAKETWQNFYDLSTDKLYKYSY